MERYKKKLLFGLFMSAKTVPPGELDFEDFNLR